MSEIYSWKNIFKKSSFAIKFSTLPDSIPGKNLRQKQKITLAPFLSPSVLTPSNLRRRKYEISISVKISGSDPTSPRT